MFQVHLEPCAAPGPDRVRQFRRGKSFVVAAIFMDGLTVREMCRGEKNDVEEARVGGE